MDDCPLVRHVENLELLKKFDQTGQVAIPISDWIWFFEALAFLAHSGGQREIYCAIGTGYLTHDPVEKPTDEAVRPAFFHPDDAFAPPFRSGFFVVLSAIGAYRRELRALCASLPCGVKIYPQEKSRSAMFSASEVTG